MGEIKFRAWEKSLKQMIIVDDIDFKNGMINTGTAWRMFDEIELMQYTGLKDSNGKEIYEGDIARHNQYVEYGKLSEHIGVISISPLDGVMVGQNSIGKDIEVIGNIWENPELIEKAQA